MQKTARKTAAYLKNWGNEYLIWKNPLEGAFDVSVTLYNLKN